MQIDRTLQKEILETAKNTYPNKCYPNKYKTLWGRDFFIPNVVYLAEHGLIECDYQETSRAPTGGMVMYFKIMKKGIDFLEKDGGLTAYFNKFTIKIDNEDMAKLLAARLEASTMTAEEKSTIMDTVKKLPGEGIKALSTELIKIGISKAPDVWQLIQTAL